MASTRGVQRIAPLCRGLLGPPHRALSSRSTGKEFTGRDSDFGFLFEDSPPLDSAHSKGSSTASPRTGETTPLWKTLMEEPTKKSVTEERKGSWSFLDDLGVSQRRYSHPQAQTPSPSSYSFRNLGEDSGFDFLKEEVDRPKRKEPDEQQESGKDNLLNSASFKLLRDSFLQKSASQSSRETKTIIDDAIGLDSSLLSSSDTWNKNVDSRSLAELEYGFQSTDQSPVEDVKTYTFEELGDKLRELRPPAEQILSSATGLSFGELHARFEKIKQAEREEIESKVVNDDYKQLKESLYQLKPIDTKKQLSYEELAFVNQVGMRTEVRGKLEYMPPKDDLLTKYYSDVQLSSKERLALEIKKLKEEFQTHECDSGSPQVQIAILTARINNLNRHMREGPNFKRDKHSKKGLSDMVQYRKRMLRYLRRRDWPAYCNVLTKLKLEDVILEKRR